jgi:hypothetical protein
MPATTPDVIIEPFGLNAASPANLQLPIPVPTQLPGNPGFASFNDGFPSDTFGGGGLPPRGQDMNGILYMVTSYLQALTGGQFWPYNATWEAANSGYAVGAVLAMSGGNGFWVNTVASNTTNPDTAPPTTSGWIPLAAPNWVSITGLTGGAVTLTGPQAACGTIFLSGTLTSNLQLIFPAWVKEWRIVNNTTGAFSVTCEGIGGGSGQAAALPNNGWTLFYSDGAVLHWMGYYCVGTFPITWVGFSSPPAGNSAEFSVAGTEVNIYIVGSGTGTSNSVNFGMSGLPTYLQPSAAQTVPIIGLEDNGTVLNSTVCNINTTITFWSSPAGLNSWTASGTKGVGVSYGPIIKYTLAAI